MRICNLTFSMAVASAQLQFFARELEDEVAIQKRIEHEFVEVETIPFAGDNVGMTVYVGATDFLFSDQMDTDLVVRLEFYDVLLGNLIEGSYYQTYYMLPSPTLPGSFESFTCTAKYNKANEKADDFGVLTYEGSETFARDYSTNEKKSGTWSTINSSDLMDNQDMKYAGWFEEPDTQSAYPIYYD